MFGWSSEGDDGFSGAWPEVHIEAWCGEHEPTADLSDIDTSADSVAGLEDHEQMDYNDKIAAKIKEEEDAQAGAMSIIAGIKAI